MDVKFPRCESDFQINEPTEVIQMEFILRKRGEGKTSTLLRKVATDDYLMVCQSEKCVRHILRMAEREGLSIRRPITFDDLYNGANLRGIRCKGLIIDDLDVLLIYLLQRLAQGNNIIAASATGDLDLFNQLR